jgi:hypothetical protein
MGWKWLLILPDTIESNMILKVLTHAGQVLQNRDSKSL